MTALADRLAARLAIEAEARSVPLVVGLCGAQGSGKSTLSDQLVARLAGAGLRAALVSLDDLYLTRAERQRLAVEVHPLLATRGVPGTHDVDLGHATLDALAGAGAVALPRFDKGADDRAAPAAWPQVDAPADLILFEGWCVGAVPQPSEALDRPVNPLEAAEDSAGRWRAYVNDALAGPYRALFGRIDLLVQLAAPDFGVVLGWRQEQEHKLREAGGGARVMSDAEVARFIQHYERLTRWTLAEMPDRADILVRLGPAREVLETRGL